LSYHLTRPMTAPRRPAAPWIPRAVSPEFRRWWAHEGAEFVF
jgi:hypothetical protein